MEGNSRGKCSAYLQKIKSDSVIFGIGDKVSPNNYVAILTNKSLFEFFKFRIPVPAHLRQVI